MVTRTVRTNKRACSSCGAGLRTRHRVRLPSPRVLRRQAQRARYPPDYPLILELGNERHQYGRSLHSPALKWELGRWYHVAVVFRSDRHESTATHYRDGQALGTQTAGEPFHSGDHDLLLGAYGGLHFLNGAWTK